MKKLTLEGLAELIARADIIEANGERQCSEEGQAPCKKDDPR